MPSDSYNQSNQPNKTTGQYHSLKGTVVETIGDLTGAQTWQQSGKDEHAHGEAEYNAAQAETFIEGAADRISGKGRRLGALMGDKQLQAAGNARHDQGQAQQDLNTPSSL